MRYSISLIPHIYFVCHPPCQSEPSRYPHYRLHFTRRNGHLPGALPNLKHLTFGFRSPLARPVQIRLHPLTRAALPTLAHFSFSGVSEYLEDFLARIDTPLLNRLVVAFFMDLIFDIPQLHGFARHIERPKPFKQAKIEFSGPVINIIFGSLTRFALEIRCERPDWQLSSMVQVFSQQLPILSHIERLELRESPWEYIRWKDDPDLGSLLWLELFHMFIAVRSLYVPGILVPLLHPLFKSSRKGWPWKCYPYCVIFFWKEFSHPNLYMEP